MQPSLTWISAPLIDLLGSVLYDIELPVATEDARYSGGVLFVSVPDVDIDATLYSEPGASRHGGAYDMMRS